METFNAFYNKLMVYPHYLTFRKQMSLKENFLINASVVLLVAFTANCT